MPAIINPMVAEAIAWTMEADSLAPELDELVGNPEGAESIDQWLDGAVIAVLDTMEDFDRRRTIQVLQFFAQQR